MNNDIFENAFNAIDDALIAEAKSPAIRIAVRRKKIIISAVAACVAAVLVAIPSVKVISDLNDNQFTESDDTEIIYITEENTSSESSQSESSQNESPQSKPQSTNSKPLGHTNSSQTNSAPGSSGNSSKPAGNDNSDITIFYNPVDVSDTYRDPLATTYDKLNINDMPFVITDNDSTISAPAGTQSYDKIYVPDIKYLYINPIPLSEYITYYYNKNTYDNPPSEKEARAYLDSFLPKLANAFQILTPQYTLEHESYMDDGEYSAYIILHDKNDYSMFFDHREFFNEINLSPNNVTKKEKLMIDGQKVTIDHTKTDQEIIESLSWVKQRLFGIFGVSFDDAKIIRDYGETYGYVYVYFYKPNDIISETDGYAPSTNYIKIEFSGNMVENTLLDGHDVDCNISRATKVAHVEGNTFKLMPLEKAEEYLYKDYVFGGPSCPLCRKDQEAVDFEGYDYVGINFKSSHKLRSMFPCYTFYKKIGTTETGRMIFAKTHVPAIEVEGYEEYFENQHANHNN